MRGLGSDKVRKRLKNSDGAEGQLASGWGTALECKAVGALEAVCVFVEVVMLIAVAVLF